MIEREVEEENINEADVGSKKRGRDFDKKKKSELKNRIFWVLTGSRCL